MDPYVRALLEERRGYEAHGHADRVAEVDAELRRVGYYPPEAATLAPAAERAVRQTPRPRKAK